MYTEDISPLLTWLCNMTLITMIIFESQQNCQWLCLPGLKAAYKTSYLEDLAFYWINVVMMMITMIFDHLSIKATCSQNISPRTTSPPLLLKRSWISLNDYQWSTPKLYSELWNSHILSHSHIFLWEGKLWCQNKPAYLRLHPAINPQISFVLFVLKGNLLGASRGRC